MKSETKHRLNWYFLAGAALLSFVAGLFLLKTYIRLPQVPLQQEEIRHHEENLLAEKILKVLEPVVGKDKVRAEVHLDLNFDTIVTNEEIYNPDSQVLRSYRAEDHFASEVAYEINKTNRHVTQSGAKIRRLSVLIMVDDLRDGTYAQERSRKEMNYLASLVVPVIGYDKSRGDTIRMESIRFERWTLESEKLTNILIGIICVLLFILILYAKNRRVEKNKFYKTVQNKNNSIPENRNNAEKKKNETIWQQLEKTDADILRSYLERETPEVAAYIISQLDSYKGGNIISALAPDFAAAVLSCLSAGSSVNTELAQEIEKTLSDDFNSQKNFGSSYVQKIFKNLNFKKQKKILNVLEHENFAVAEKLRTEMFNFEDFTTVTDKDLKCLLKETETKDLALALRGASEKLQQHMFKNMHKSMATEVKKQMMELGPVRLRQVEEAQDKIMSIALVLQYEKKIILQKNNGAEV